MNDEIRQFREACADYEKMWQVTDETLYALCRRHPGHADRGSINAKLWIIGRTYATGIERKISSDGSQGSSLTRLADLLENKHAAVDAIIGTLNSVREPLDTAQLRTILCAHGALLKLVRPLLRNRQSPRSFVSKYLHFHCPAVPIFDSIAMRKLTKLSPWRQLTNKLTIPSEADPEYGWYVSRFWQLYSDLRSAGANVTVKTLDHFILSACT